MSEIKSKEDIVQIYKNNSMREPIFNELLLEVLCDIRDVLNHISYLIDLKGRSHERAN